jgi:ribosomal-protein-alanine N-acetyltransferase
MMDFIANLFARPQPSLSEAKPGDAADLAALHGASFHRGWSEDEFERLLLDRAVVAHRIVIGRRLVGFIISRIIAGEAEILSVAHLRRLAGLGTRTVFLEVDEGNVPANRLYQRAGFRTVGRREGYYPDRTDKDRERDFPGQAKSAAALVLRCELP